MLRIRLSRMGRRNRPFYRIVVADARAPRDGRFVEIIGHYDPLPDPAKVEVDEERAVYWLKQGAQPTEAVAKLFTRLGIMEKAGLPPFVYTKHLARIQAARQE
ncbi:MAG TPA: 30S ribosomal protein S16 [Dehalococcoidia bacterium]|nr:30S ribosomal protein S16 [Dehalococcoidia bacterium]